MKTQKLGKKNGIKMQTELIVALDFDSLEKTLELVDKIKDKVRYFKVGKELFTTCGPLVIQEIQKRQGKVFLDLKFHDIPNTVAKAIAVAEKMGVAISNVHACGGLKMLQAASEQAKTHELFAVTILTSLSQTEMTNEILYPKTLEDMVLHFASLAQKANLTGVVCSPKEIKMIKSKLGSDFKTLTPGIRPSWAQKNDQTRVLTPREAKDLGTDYIVVGRPITKSQNPIKAVDDILLELQS